MYIKGEFEMKLLLERISSEKYEAQVKLSFGGKWWLTTGLFMQLWQRENDSVW